jgi:SAM-dependent methyltransferase
VANPDSDTRSREYTERLVRLQHSRWKRLLRPFVPYRWNLRGLRPGFTLEIGCGIGRNLDYLDGNAIGLDLNSHSVAAARRLGFRAFTPDEFTASQWCRPGAFDSLLLSHVAEHMQRAELLSLLRQHLGFVRSGGRLILETPQELGFRSDPSHVEFLDSAALREVVDALGLVTTREYSFPFPRFFGRLFIYNEFVSVSRKP